jgi:hypothetical protein
MFKETFQEISWKMNRRMSRMKFQEMHEEIQKEQENNASVPTYNISLGPPVGYCAL